MRLLRREQALKDKLLSILDTIKNQYVKLTLIKHRLKAKEKLLMDRLPQINNKDLAVAVANEIADIRKLYASLENILVALESFMLRAETVITINEFTKVISPISKMLSSIREDANKLSPLLASEMEELMNSLENLKVNYKENEIFTPLTLEDTELILKEAAEVASKKVITSIPEIPLSKHDKKLSDQPMMEAEGYGTVSLNYSDSLLEDKLMRYIIEKNGKIDLKKCSEELGVTQSKLSQVIEDLIRQGKIQKIK